MSALTKAAKRSAKTTVESSIDGIFIRQPTMAEIEQLQEMGEDGLAIAKWAVLHLAVDEDGAPAAESEEEVAACPIDVLLTLGDDIGNLISGNRPAAREG